jgi:hypothetical protein
MLQGVSPAGLTPPSSLTMSMAERSASSSFVWNFFNPFNKGRNQPAPVPSAPSDPRPDLKRRWDSGVETEEESPQTKRIRRLSPSRSSSRMQTEPVSAMRRSASVKALVKPHSYYVRLTLLTNKTQNPNVVHSSGVSKNLFSSLASDASFARGKSVISRSSSLAITNGFGDLNIHNTSSPTPGADWSSRARTAGVSQGKYNVNSSLAQTETLSFQNNTTFSNGPVRSALRQETPSSVSFGSKQTPDPRAMSLASRKSPSESPPKTSKPTLNRHSESAPWAGRSGSTRQRLGDVSPKFLISFH